MKSTKVSEATGAALNWLVAKAEGHTLLKDQLLGGNFMKGWYVSGRQPNPNAWAHISGLRYSTDWAQGGPLVEREQIRLSVGDDGQWWAETRLYADGRKAFTTSFDKAVTGQGATPLAAAMRVYVVSKLGDTVEVPEELVS